MAGNGNGKKPSGLAEATPHYHGHRQRLRQRLLEAGSNAVRDYELLELILFRAFPQRDVKPGKESNRAVRLVRRSRFGTGGAIARSQGHGRCRHRRTQDRAGCRKRIRPRPSQETAPARILVERTRLLPQLRILFLDKRNQLIADEVQQVGTIDHTPVYPRDVLKRALELSATAIILVHNHPTHRLACTLNHA
jgi:DNA repair protein RadC